MLSRRLTVTENITSHITVVTVFVLAKKKNDNNIPRFLHECQNAVAPALY